MLLTLCVLISYNFLEINTFTVNYKNGIRQDTKQFQNITRNLDTVSGGRLEDGVRFITILPNTIKSTNLKYNIFDKMLSNEMLSIKHHLFDKNSTHASSVYISMQDNVPTPTLELKQKWPIDKLFLKSKIESINPKSTEDSDNKENVIISSPDSTITTVVDSEFVSENHNIDYKRHKIIEVRSFADMPVHNTKSPSILRQKQICSCMKTNQETACSKQCTASEECSITKKVCTHSDECKTCKSDCTRTAMNNIMSITLYPYYASYFLGVPTEPPNIYYHPNVINELKLPKHKDRPSNKPYSYQLEENDAKEENYNYDDSGKDYYLDPSVTEYKNKKYRKCKHKHNANLIQSVDDFGNMQIVDKDRFIAEVVDDLKAYYSDAVIKDCYCSFSAFNLKIQYKFIILYTCLILVIM